MSQEIEKLKTELADARSTIEEYKQAFDGLMDQNEQYREKFYDALLFIEHFLDKHVELVKKLIFEKKWNLWVTTIYFIIVVIESYYIINHIK